MISLDNKRIVDLSNEMICAVTRLDRTFEEGQPDAYGLPWIVEETINEKDGTVEQLIGHNRGTFEAWPYGSHSAHHGSHVQLGPGHNDNWSGLPDGMLGIWDMPISTYYGEAVVCDLSHLKKEPILPSHLENIKEGDIVLLHSCWSDDDQPWIEGDTAYWLADQKIKMLGVGVPGISWETRMHDPEPENCPTHRAMTGNNIPIVYPLSNIDKLKQDRVFFMGLPLNVERMEGTAVRAIAIEEAV